MMDMFNIMAEDDHFVYIMWTILFYAALWFSGVLFELIGGAGLVAEIIVGIILGPSLLNIVPEPDAVMLYGDIGLMLLLLEAGLCVDIGMLRQLGLRAVMVGIAGTSVPIAMGTGLAYAIGYTDPKAAFAAGCILAPTSTGIAIEIFKSMDVLSSPVGQLVTTAAVIDDVISLVILSILQALASTTSTTIDYIIPILSSLGYLVIVGGLSVGIPAYLSQYPGSPLQNIPFKYHKTITLAIVMCYGAALAAACHYTKSSHLLGAFLAGLGFCRVHIIHEQWDKHVAPVLKWLLKAFFAGTVAFQVPRLEVFGDATVIGHGFLMFLPVIGKLVTGFFVVPLNTMGFFKVGVAMSSWGEIAFLMATVVKGAGLIDEKLYASMVFAVLFSALVSPFGLRFLLVREKKEKLKEQAREAKERKNSEMVYWSVIVNCNPQWGLYDSLSQKAANLNLEIVEAKLQTDTSGKVSDRIVMKDKARNVVDRKQMIKDAFAKCINDPNPELIVSRWFSDTEINDTTEEFVHIDPDQFSVDGSEGSLIEKEESDDEDKKNDDGNENTRLINTEKTNYGT